MKEIGELPTGRIDISGNGTGQLVFEPDWRTPRKDFCEHFRED
jgi:hypothetical protein